MLPSLRDLEPEYITISDDGATAYICRENNALVIVGLVRNGYRDPAFGL